MIKKLQFSLFSLFLCSVSLLAETSVWKITKGRGTLYIGGTCSLLRSADFPLPQEFDQAFRNSDQVYLETDFGQVQSPKMQEAIAAQSVYPDGTTLESLLAPETWKSVQASCTVAGIPADNLKKVRPWRCASMLTALGLQRMDWSRQSADQYYYQKAFSAGKTVGRLETAEQHLDYLAHLGIGHENQLIQYSLNDISKSPEKSDQLVRAWKTGDLAKVDELSLREMREQYPVVYQELIVSRNTALLPQLESLLDSRKSKLVLVNIDNLAGADGLLAQLREQGYTIEQSRQIARN